MLVGFVSGEVDENGSPLIDIYDGCGVPRGKYTDHEIPDGALRACHTTLGDNATPAGRKHRAKRHADALVERAERARHTKEHSP